jgi:hypothetical protein
MIATSLPWILLFALFLTAIVVWMARSRNE